MIRVRLQFRKTGSIRYTSHLDTARLFQRCFMASGFPVSFSQGFHPHPRMSFGPPLRTGWEGLDEYLDVYVEQPVEDIAGRCNPHLPGGMSITAHAVVPGDSPKLPEDIVAARFRVKIPAGADAIDPLKPFEAGDVQGSEEHAASASGFRPQVLDLSVVGGPAVEIEYMTTMKGGKCVAPDELAAGLVEGGALSEPLQAARTELFIRRKGVFLSPLHEGMRE